MTENKTQRIDFRQKRAELAKVGAPAPTVPAPSQPAAPHLETDEHGIVRPKSADEEALYIELFNLEGDESQAAFWRRNEIADELEGRGMTQDPAPAHQFIKIEEGEIMAVIVEGVEWVKDDEKPTGKQECYRVKVKGESKLLGGLYGLRELAFYAPGQPVIIRSLGKIQHPTKKAQTIHQFRFSPPAPLPRRERLPVVDTTQQVE